MDPLRPSTVRPAPRVAWLRRPRHATPPRSHLRRWILFGLVVLAAGLLVPPAPLRAAGVVGTGTPASCTEAAFTSALAGGGLVTFNCGTAPHVIVLTSEQLPAQDITIDGGGSITLSGGNSTPLLYVLGGKTMELRKLTISNGFNAGRDGGAVRNDGTLRLSDTVFKDNQTTANWSGGAIVSFGTLEITNSTFENNRGGNAGAIYPRFSAAVTTVTGSMFRTNQAIAPDTGWGGALVLWDGAHVTVRDSQFLGNTARQGGAVYVRANSRLDIDNGAIRDNEAATYGGGIFNNGQLRLGQVQLSTNTVTVDGGGILNFTGAVATISGGMLNGNSAGADGGAIANYGDLTLDGAAVVDNRAAWGGGMFNLKGQLRVRNTTISGNWGDGGGGGVGDRDGSVALTNVTLANNTYSGLATRLEVNTSNVTLVNTLVADHERGRNCGVWEIKTFSSQFSVSDDDTCTWTGSNNRSSTAANLAPLADNGGATLTQLPQPGSVAIDGGTGSGCPATDQRGVARPQGVSCDIGAVEVGPAPPATFRALVPLVQR